MKKGQMRTVFGMGFAVLLMFALILAVHAWTAPTVQYPVDNAYNKTVTVVVNCTVTPLAQLMVLNISLWDNYSGVYLRNQTVSTMVNNTGLVASTLFNVTLAENKHIAWACTYDEGNGTSGSTFNHTALANITANRTMVGDFQNPVITDVNPLVKISDNRFLRSSNITFRLQDAHFGNASACSIFTNTSGVWTANVTNVSLGGEVGGFGGGAASDITINLTFNPALPSGFYSYYAACNDSVGRYTATGNSTFKVVSAPNLSWQSPASLAWVGNYLNVSIIAQTKPGTVGTTVDNEVGDYTCELYTNESALISNSNWSRVAEYSLKNATDTLAESGVAGFYSFAGSSLKGANTTFLAGLKCYETNQPEAYNWTANRTVRVDFNAPNVTIVSVQYGYLGNIVVGLANGTNSSNTTILVGVRAVEPNLGNCTFYSQDDTDAWNAQVFNASVGDISSGTNFNVSVADLTGGSYDFYVSCMDNSTNKVTSPNYTVNVNGQGLTFTFANDSSMISGFNSTRLGRAYTGRSDAINITVTTPNLTSISINYSSENDGSGILTDDGRYATVHNVTLFFNTSEDSVALNVTVTDYFGRRNSTGTIRVKLPAKIRTGWSGYSVTQSHGMTLFNISVQTGGDAVSVWNTTRQRWITYTSGATDMDVFVPQGHAVFIYESSNGTWRRMVNSTAYYEYNVTGWNRSADNFLGLVRGGIDFAHINATFRNSTGGIWLENGTSVFRDMDSKDSTNLTSRTPFNFTQFAVWNNTNQQWEGYTASRTINPTLQLNRNGSTVLWVLALNATGYPRNVSWNGTAFHNTSGWAK